MLRQNYYIHTTILPESVGPVHNGGSSQFCQQIPVCLVAGMASIFTPYLLAFEHAHGHASGSSRCHWGHADARATQGPGIQITAPINSKTNGNIKQALFRHEMYTCVCDNTPPPPPPLSLSPTLSSHKSQTSVVIHVKSPKRLTSYSSKPLQVRQRKRVVRSRPATLITSPAASLEERQ